MFRSRFEKKAASKVEREQGFCAVWAIGPRAGVLVDPDRLNPQALSSWWQSLWAKLKGKVNGTPEPLDFELPRNRPVKFGTSKDPDTLLRKARLWNWEHLDLLAVVWFASADDAEAVKEELDEICGFGQPISPTWFDMTADVAEEMIRLAASAEGISIIDDKTRAERLRQGVRREIERMQRENRRK